jgi:hypothetical protein
MQLPEDKLDLILEILRQHDKRFEQMETNLRDFKQEVKEEFKDLKYALRLDKEKLEKVYEARERVTVSFTRSWATASFFIALIASTIVLAVAKAF